MGQSYRIRTEQGINKTITVQLDQEFEFLEILSLKIQQADIYLRNCSDYGVVVGRVTANNGFGVPNARISVFIPIDVVDQSNPIVTSIYPYKSPADKNEDGYRYNLLPYEKSYSKHAATGTLPSRLDVLTGQTAIEIYDKYYKYTAKTNESGDYMIMGVPLGAQTLFMDVDLSDIGEFSLTPQDLIRMGLATESQVAGNQFRTSNDLNSLPQIISITKTLEIAPLWGDPSICQLAINRVDFDLRDDANINIQPTAVFMGSMFTSPDKFRIRNNCKPRDNMGNLCNLDTGPGQILAIRQTIGQDSDGNPILEQYQLEQSGNIIDGNGVWLTELPMNLEYVITNEFGEKVVSHDPSIGIPTKGKYRFKIKWQQPATLTEQTRRAYYLVPNVREYGWTYSAEDPINDSKTSDKGKQLASSYYFGLNWTGYTDGMPDTKKNDKIDEIIDCQDTFYEFNFNKVYTVASLIDEYKNGGRGRFVGIKEIDNDDCSSTVNKFPTNDGFRNFDFLFFIFSLLLQLFQVIGIPVLIVAHIVLFIYSLIIGLLCLLCGIKIPVINVRPFGFICNLLNVKCQKQNFTVRLPMITYPDCEACQCKETSLTSESVGNGANGVLSYFSYSSDYYENLQSIITINEPDQENIINKSLMYSQAIAGNGDNVSDVRLFKMPKSQVVKLPSNDRRYFAFSSDLPLGERINIFNTRDSYFSNEINKIQVTFAKDSNNGRIHFDNTITVVANVPFTSGDLLTSVDPGTSSDLNFLYTATTDNGIIQGITGVTQTLPFQLPVEYAITQSSNSAPVLYQMPTGTTINRQLYPMDREYFQVITAITISEASKIWTTSSAQSLPDILNSSVDVIMMRHGGSNYDYHQTDTYKYSDVFSNFNSQYIVILQRGVDPYSPKFNNEYGVGKIFGKTNASDITITASTRVNIPIQKLNSTAQSVQVFTQNNIFYQSKFFTPGNNFSGFTTSSVGYYGALDSSYPFTSRFNDVPVNGAMGVVTSTANDFYDSSVSVAKYDTSEDVSGGSFIYSNNYNGNISFSFSSTYSNLDFSYTTPNLYPSLTGSPMSIGNKVTNVMRNDRLPSSDALNGQSWTTNPALLQQNNNFKFYIVPELDGNATSPGYSTGASQVQPDLEGQPLSGTVISSFDCMGMVGLNCYSGDGYTFGIKDNCPETDSLERGCYVFLRNPIDLIGDTIRDLKSFAEWGYRFRFFYGLCRGVLAQSFMNNWVNGTLYAFPIQTNTWYDKQNQPYTTYCTDLIYFDSKTTNFYYRSSPYKYSTNEFIGKEALDFRAVNKKNLLFPTTIVNLGVKDSFYQEITFDPSNKAYIVDKLNPTSHGDNSDIVNLFVTSRIANSSFLKELFGAADNALNQLFSRDNVSLFNQSRRIDGDLAQLMSINSEVGVINFSPEFYTGNTMYVGSNGNSAVIGIYFSSTTENLQLKDYLTPGIIDFRGPDVTDYYPYPYGIKSQVVPFYRWQLANTATPKIFGTELNNWATNFSDIVQGKQYQSLDRTIKPYFQSSTVPNEIYQRGYIFSVDSNGDYNGYAPNSNNVVINSKFLVGAPFHFYFGVIKGESALDKFKTKYSIGE